MNSQKVNFIPTYNGVPITDYTPEEESIFLDVIDMPEANKAWSLHVMPFFLAEGKITFYASNSLDTEFVQYTLVSIDIPFETTVIISESNFNYRYMLLKLDLPESGPVSISMVK